MALSAAVHGREVLRFDYGQAHRPGASNQDRAAMPAASPRRVEPHHVVTWGGRWYLVAWDLDRADWRTFRVDRITPRTPTGPRFTPRDLPGGNVEAFVSARFQGSDPTDGSPNSGGWPCRGEVIIDLPAAVVLTYTREGLVEDHGPHRCRLVLGSWSWTALAAALGRFDADIEVVGPAELKTAFGQLARRYHAATGSPTTTAVR
jgi:predicted DNA-binding transcriptional regulator YafY